MLSLELVSVPGRLRDIQTEVPAGTLVGLLGPNGSGKSTLLSALAGLLTFQGQIKWQQESIRRWSINDAAQYRAMLPQRSQYALSIPCYQVLEMGFAPLSARDELTAKAFAKVCELLELDPFLGRDFSRLSGGEQQRILLAKTLLQVWPGLNAKARFLLLDEPLAGLDWYYQIRALELLKWLSAQGLTIVTSLHDFNLAVNYMPVIWCLADQTLVFADRADIFSEQEILRSFRLKTRRVVSEDQIIFLPESNPLTGLAGSRS